MSDTIRSLNSATALNTNVSVEKTPSSHDISIGKSVATNTSSVDTSSISNTQINTTTIQSDNLGVFSTSITASAAVKEAIVTLAENKDASLADFKELYTKFSGEANRAYIDVAIQSYIAVSCGEMDFEILGKDETFQRLATIMWDIAKSDDLNTLLDLQKELTALVKDAASLKDNESMASLASNPKLNEIFLFLDEAIANKATLVSILENNKDLESQPIETVNEDDFVKLKDIQNQGNFNAAVLGDLEMKFKALEDSFSSKAQEQERFVSHMQSKISAFDEVHDDISALKEQCAGNTALLSQLQALSTANKDSLLAQINSITDDENLSNTEKFNKLKTLSSSIDRLTLDEDAFLLKSTIISKLQIQYGISDATLSVSHDKLGFTQTLKYIDILANCGDNDLGFGPISQDPVFLDALCATITQNDPKISLYLFQILSESNLSGNTPEVLSKLENLASALALNNVKGALELSYILDTLSLVDLKSRPEFKLEKFDSESLLKLASAFENSNDNSFSNISPTIANCAFLLFKLEQNLYGDIAMDDSQAFMTKVQDVNPQLYDYIQKHSSGLPKNINAGVIATFKFNQALLARETNRKTLLSLDPDYVAYTNEKRLLRMMESYLGLNSQSHSITAKSLQETIKKISQNEIDSLDIPKYSQEQIKQFILHNFEGFVASLNQTKHLDALLHMADKKIPAGEKAQVTLDSLATLDVLGETVAYQLLAIAQNTIFSVKDMSDTMLKELGLDPQNIQLENLVDAIVKLAAKPMSNIEIRALAKSYIEISQLENKLGRLKSINNLREALNAKLSMLEGISYQTVDNIMGLLDIDDADAQRARKFITSSIISSHLNLQDLSGFLDKSYIKSLEKEINSLNKKTKDEQAIQIAQSNVSLIVDKLFESQINFLVINQLLSNLSSIKDKTDNYLKLADFNFDYDKLKDLLDNFEKTGNKQIKAQIIGQIREMFTENILDRLKFQIAIKDHRDKARLENAAAVEHGVKKALESKGDIRDFIGKQLKRSVLANVNTLNKILDIGDGINTYQNKQFRLFMKMHNDKNFADTVLSVAVFNAMTAMGITSIRGFKSELNKISPDGKTKNYDRALNAMKDAMHDLGLPFGICDDLAVGFLNDPHLSLRLSGIALKEGLINLNHSIRSAIVEGGEAKGAQGIIKAEVFRSQVEHLLDNLDVNQGVSFDRDLNVEVFSAEVSDNAKVSVALGAHSLFGFEKSAEGFVFSLDAELYAKVEASLEGIEKGNVSFEAQAEAKVKGGSHVNLTFKNTDSAATFIANIMTFAYDSFNVNVATNVSQDFNIGASAQAEASASVNILEMGDINTNVTAGVTLSLSGAIETSRGFSLNHKIKTYDFDAQATLSAGVTLEIDSDAVKEHAQELGDTIAGSDFVINAGKSLGENLPVLEDTVSQQIEDLPDNLADGAESLTERANEAIDEKLGIKKELSFIHHNHIEVHNDTLNKDALVSITSNISIRPPFEKTGIVTALISYGLSQAEANRLADNILSQNPQEISAITLNREAVLSNVQKDTLKDPSLKDISKLTFSPQSITVEYNETTLREKKTSLLIYHNQERAFSSVKREIAVA